MTQGQNKGIPANIEAERAVLGAFLIDSESFIKVASLLRPEDFYLERHRWIVEAIIALNERNEPLDTVTLLDEMERRGQLNEIGGPAYIVDLINSTPTAIYVEHYATIVARDAQLRRLIGAAGKIAEVAYDEENAEVALSRAEQIMFGVTQGRALRNTYHIGEVLHKVVDQISDLASHPDKAVGIPTGFTMLDRMLGGLHKSDLIYLAARPGMGKSSLALSIARNVAMRYGGKVLIFTLEMSSEQMVSRILSMETAIDSHRIRMGALEDGEMSIIVEASNNLAQCGIFIDDTPGASITDIRTKSKRIYAEHGLDMIIVDYIQLMAGPGGSGSGGENRQQEISFISRQLKALARELNVPLIALSQLSRAVENRADKRPMLSDLRESGSLEQDSDLVMFIYREDYYVEDSDKQNIADILVAKHRHGSTGTVSLYFRKELTQFRDLEIQRTELDYDASPSMRHVNGVPKF